MPHALQPHESVVLSAQIVEELKEVKLTLLLLFIAEVGTNSPRVWTASSMADPIVSRTKSAALLFQRIPDAEEADIKIGILDPHAKYLLPSNAEICYIPNTGSRMSPVFRV